MTINKSDEVATARFESMLAEGISGEVSEMTPNDWVEIRAEAIAILKARQAGRADG